MPGFDGTGPVGYGAMTGRGFGFCNPYGFRRGFYPRGGRGRGMGVRMGWGRGPYYAPYPAAPFPGYAPASYEPMVDEQETLKQEAEYLENELKVIKQRLEEIEKQEE